MPNYIYACELCGDRFERHYSTISKASEFLDNAECPSCLNQAKRTIESAPQIFFKGGGWTARAGAFYSNPSDPTKGLKIDPKNPDAMHRE
jgi:putative FmdB family regulatory protein